MVFKRKFEAEYKALGEGCYLVNIITYQEPMVDCLDLKSNMSNNIKSPITFTSSRENNIDEPTF